MGYLNKDGEVVIAIKYKQAQDFYNGFALVRDIEGNVLFVDREGNEYKTNLKSNVIQVYPWCI